ncbi:putative kelch-type beta propeller [Helianthus annuus]|uniref:Putative galactose oxidase, beta-propeller n=2 Tax=Helianthus annuus TaxID=4232 RepID=A0A251T7Z6_HELAN|nr:putative kelch-type beta propeller [Helianthus annuus]
MSSLIHVIGRDLTMKSLMCLPRYNYARIASLNRSFRELIRSGELYRLRSVHQVIEHWVYFSCDPLKWEAFDPVNEKWMNLPMMDTDLGFQFSDKESMAVGTDLLVIGNDMLGPGIYKYSLLTNSWSQGLPMNEPRWLLGSASFKNIAIFAGGVDRNGKIMDAVESYDSETGTWKTLPSMIKPRKLSSGVFMDGKFYVIGGISSNDSNPLTCGEEYDLDTQKWTEIPNMSPGGGGPGMAPPLLAVASNELYAADCAAMELKIYSKKNKEWVAIGRLPEIAHSRDGWGIAFRGCGNRVVIICGPRDTQNRYIEIYSWVPSEGPPQWMRIGWKSSNNFVFNCAIMGC